LVKSYRRFEGTTKPRNIQKHRIASQKKSIFGFVLIFLTYKHVYHFPPPLQTPFFHIFIFPFLFLISVSVDIYSLHDYCSLPFIPFLFLFSILIFILSFCSYVRKLYLTCTAHTIGLQIRPSRVFRDNTLTYIFRHISISYAKCLLPLSFLSVSLLASIS
jgi:hypothetical protein